MMLLERVRDILEKDKAKDDMLIFGCVHTATQGVGRSPELGLETKGGAVLFSSRPNSARFGRHYFPLLYNLFIH